MHRNHTGPNLSKTENHDRTSVIIAARAITQQRKGAREKAEQTRLSNHHAPRLWVHAHIQSRADFPSGYLAEISRDPKQANHYREYLNESRTAYRASR